MTTQVLPSDGVTVWRVDGVPFGESWIRVRKDGDPYTVPAGREASRCCWDEPDVTDAPQFCRTMWRLAESAPGWGWRLYRMRDVGWHLEVTDPEGTEARFTWVGPQLVAQTGTIAGVIDHLGGAGITNPG